MGFDYVAVEWPATAPDPQPEQRRELEDLGFVLLGGCALDDRHHREVGRMASSYGDRAPDLVEWAAQPGQVFAAPDGTAFVQLAWLWDCRYACFSTVLADGRILQTMTEWGADPAWPRQMARHQGRADRHTEQLALATDRDAHVVDGVRQAWEEHRGRVLAAGTDVPAHTRLEDFVRLWTAESRVRSRWTARTHWVLWGLLVVVLVSAFTVVGVLLGAQPWWVDAAVLLVGMLVARTIYVPTWLRVRRWRWLWPSFRAPVPGTGS